MKRKRENYIGENVKSLKKGHTLREGQWTKPYLNEERNPLWEGYADSEEFKEHCKEQNLNYEKSKKLVEEFHDKSNKPSIDKKLFVKHCQYRDHCILTTSSSGDVGLLESKCPYFVEWEEQSYNTHEELKYYKKDRSNRVVCSLPKSVEFIIGD